MRPSEIPKSPSEQMWDAALGRGKWAENRQHANRIDILEGEMYLVKGLIEPLPVRTLATQDEVCKLKDQVLFLGAKLDALTFYVNLNARGGIRHRLIAWCRDSLARLYDRRNHRQRPEIR